MGDVSKKLMDQFAANLNEMLDDEGQDAGTPHEAPGEAADDAAATADAEPEPAVRRINGPAAEPVDLADMAGPALLKRIGPAVLAVVLLVLLLRRRG